VPCHRERDVKKKKALPANLKVWIKAGVSKLLSRKIRESKDKKLGARGRGRARGLRRSQA